MAMMLIVMAAVTDGHDRRQQDRGGPEPALRVSGQCAHRARPAATRDPLRERRDAHGILGDDHDHARKPLSDGRSRERPSAGARQGREADTGCTDSSGRRAARAGRKAVDYLTAATVFSFAPQSTSSLAVLSVTLPVNTNPASGLPDYRLADDIVLRNSSRDMTLRTPNGPCGRSRTCVHCDGISDQGAWRARQTCEPSFGVRSATSAGSPCPWRSA